MEAVSLRIFIEFFTCSGVGESNCGVCECEIMCVLDEMMVDFWWAQSKVIMCV